MPQMAPTMWVLMLFFIFLFLLFIYSFIYFVSSTNFNLTQNPSKGLKTMNWLW